MTYFWDERKNSIFDTMTSQNVIKKNLKPLNDTLMDIYGTFLF